MACHSPLVGLPAVSHLSAHAVVGVDHEASWNSDGALLPKDARAGGDAQHFCSRKRFCI